MKKLKLVEEFYDKKKTRIAKRYYIDQDGLKQGTYEYFYENGSLVIRSTYVNNVRHGLNEIFHLDDGKLSCLTTYRKGKQDGIQVSFDCHDLVERCCFYRNGIGGSIIPLSGMTRKKFVKFLCDLSEDLSLVISRLKQTD